MRHLNIENKSGFAFEALPLADKDGQPLLVCVNKATFVLGTNGALSVAEKQMPVNLGGEHWGDPDKSSYKYEPEGAMFKPATDVVLIGQAYAPQPGVTEVDVSLRAGPVEKTVRVYGDRMWIKTWGLIGITDPRPFHRIPLLYERAFGGWDRSDPNPQRHSFEPRNPAGVGFRTKSSIFEEGLPLPNIEDPRHLVRSFGSKPPPAGFGFTSPHWQPRAQFAGTYDRKWMQERMPMLPLDLNLRYFSGASTGLVAPGFLRGDEPIVVENASAERRLFFRLPGLPPPQITVDLKEPRHATVETQLDTVIINTDQRLLLLIWRGHLTVKRGMEDVAAIELPGRSRVPLAKGA